MPEYVRQRPRVLPVVHVLDAAHAVDQSRVALGAGADGVFLIDHGGSVENTHACVRAVQDYAPEAFIGVNLLSQLLPRAVRTVAPWAISALWSDDAGIDEGLAPEDQPAGAALAEAVADSGFAGEVFGGVAFKYQRTVPDDALGRAVRAAAPWLDVVTTSGPGTGAAASMEKLSAMRAGLPPGKRLGVASGVTPETVAEVLTVVDDVLVASSICADFHTFDQARLEALLEHAHSGRH